MKKAWRIYFPASSSSPFVLSLCDTGSVCSEPSLSAHKAAVPSIWLSEEKPSHVKEPNHNENESPHNIRLEFKSGAASTVMMLYYHFHRSFSVTITHFVLENLTLQLYFQHSRRNVVWFFSCPLFICLCLSSLFTVWSDLHTALVNVPGAVIPEERLCDTNFIIPLSSKLPGLKGGFRFQPPFLILSLKSNPEVVLCPHVKEDNPPLPSDRANWGHKAAPSQWQHGPCFLSVWLSGLDSTCTVCRRGCGISV